jgi:glycerol-3-phosphate acyltransferase PlsX
VAAIRDAIRSGTVSKLGGLLVRHKLIPLRESFSQESVGGAYLLGLRGLVVVCHGNSSRGAIGNAIVLAERGVDEHLVRRTADSLAAAGVLRGGETVDASSVRADSVTSSS